MQMINIGFQNMVNAGRLVAVISPESAPIKRLISQARAQGMLIDASYGRRTRAVLVCDSGHVILCATAPESLAARMAENEEGARENE